jgi:hypothetical protein
VELLQRHHKFFSLEELNQAIRELLTKLNHRPFRKGDGSRASDPQAAGFPAHCQAKSAAFRLAAHQSILKHQPIAMQ